MIQTDKIERIPPEHWQNSQLSIAKYHGGIRIHGIMYFIDQDNWLVREDILKKEKSIRNDMLKEDIKKNKRNQYNLFGEES